MSLLELKSIDLTIKKNIRIFIIIIIIKLYIEYFSKDYVLTYSAKCSGY